VWRETLSKAVVPIFLSVLSAMLYQSGRYQLVDANREIEQNEDELQAQTDKLDQQTAEQKALTEIGDGYLEKAKERRAFLDGVVHGIYRAPNTASETHAKALKALAEVNEQLGRISGYSSLHTEYRDALVNELTAEGKVWEVIREHTTSSRNRQKDQMADEELFLTMVQWTRAKSATGSMLKEESYLWQARDGENKRQLRRSRQRLEQLKARLRIARQAFPVALFAWMMLLVYLVRPAAKKEKESRTPNFE
jgi:hypothetical protein